jgi:hypothetical protein
MTAESNSDIAAELCITHTKGDTFIRDFAFTDADGNPIDLTGYSVRLQLRESVRSSSATLDAATPNEITITGAGNNVLSVLIDAETMEIPARKYVWDLQLTTPGGVVTTYLFGNFTITSDVTR